VPFCSRKVDFRIVPGGLTLNHLSLENPMLAPKYTPSFAVLLTILTIALPCAAAPTPAQFLTPALINTNGGPQQTAAADFNHDGKIDLAVADKAGVEIMLGNGDGTFQPSHVYALNSQFGTQALAVADMNHDGVLDVIATMHNSPSSVQILLGIGDGTFNPMQGTPVSSGANGIAVGDFNGDGNLDAVVSHGNSLAVSVLLGNGDGTLQAEFNYAVTGPKHPYNVGVGDFNHDGKLDIAVADGNINVLLGNGNGTFQAATKYVSGSNAYQLEVADVNSDGLPDIVFLGSGGIGAMLSQTNGTFVGKNSDASGLGGYFTLGDFTGDGKLDVVVSGMAIFGGRGDGTFTSPKAFYTAGGVAGTMTAADVNGDSKTDVIQCLFAPDSQHLALFLGNGNGTLQAPQTFPSGALGPFLALGDFNHDGKADVAALNNNQTINIVLAKGGGIFQAPLASFSSVGADRSIAAVDLNNDNKMDLIALSSSGHVVAFLGNGDGTFQSGVAFPAGFNGLGMTVNDLNHDGNPDVAVVSSCVDASNCQNGAVNVVLGVGDGTFQAPVLYNVGKLPQSIVAADFKNSGNLDLAVTNTAGGQQNAGSVGILPSNGDGTFGAAFEIKAGSAPIGIAAADFNGDGKRDILVSNNIAGGPLNVLLNSGNGRFGTPITSLGVGATTVLTVADFNGDGVQDVAVGTGQAWVFVGNGDGTLQMPASATLLNSGTNSLIATDITGDGLPDLIVGTLLQRALTVLVNTTH
jgi:hypothetical protein